jgi:hypothetical protein
MLLKMKNILTKDIIYISEAHVCNEGQNLFVGLCTCYVMLCYVMLCYVMLCYVMLCYVIVILSLTILYVYICRESCTCMICII